MSVPKPKSEITIDLLKEEKENKEIVSRYKGLLRSIRHPLNREDKKLIREAFDLALDAHKGIRRKTGEPYIFHPIEVARIAAKEIGLGATSIACALIHDVVEDSEYGLDFIKKKFGSKIATIIDGLTKISVVFDHSDSMQAENFRKMLLTLSQDVRVILIKLCDRLHNMRTLEGMSRKNQLKIAYRNSLFICSFSPQTWALHYKNRARRPCHKIYRKRKVFRHCKQAKRNKSFQRPVCKKIFGTNKKTA